jgi:hypothetical protein
MISKRLENSILTDAIRPHVAVLTFETPADFGGPFLDSHHLGCPQHIFRKTASWPAMVAATEEIKI